jgi:choline monooxygenase
VPDLDFCFDERLASAETPDIAIGEAVQKGLKSRTYDRGRFSVLRENGVHPFHSLQARALRGD